jgi:acetyltransferase-like isoleucine patch superfamily enzyme
MWLNTPPENYNVHDFPNGDKAYIHKSANIGHLTIDRYSYVSQNVVLNGKYPIKIGAFCSVAANVYCWTYESHHTTYPTTFPLHVVLGMHVNYSDCVEKPDGVIIGNDVWIGEGARIMPGVKIADGCVIGARAVVTKDCEAYGIYVGVPAKQVEKRFPENMIEQLLKIQWWKWPIEKIRQNATFFSIDLNRFDGDLSQKIVE